MSNLGFWRDIAVIWLCLQSFILLLIPLVVTYFSVRGILWANRKLKLLVTRLQGYSRQARDKTGAFADRAAGPVIRAHVTARKVETIIEEVRS